MLLIKPIPSKKLYQDLQAQVDREIGIIKTEDFTQKRMHDLRRETAAIQVAGIAKLSEILLPHQHERLKVHAFRRKSEQASFSKILISPDVSKKIGLTSDQKRQLERVNPKLEAELQEKIRELQVEYRHELIRGLEPDQVSKVKSLLVRAISK